MTINSPLNSPVRSNRRNSWEASLEQNGREPRLKTESGSRSRNASPARSVGESDEDDDADFSGFTFDDNDNDSNSGSEEAGTQEGKGTWTREEHKRFLEAIKIYANGPWKLVAEYVGTRTVRQTMTHAQKYRQKAARRIRGLRTKQAIMRMHIGHEVSEESMLQERIRTALGETRGVGGGYLPPELATFIRSPVGSPVMPSSPVLQAAMNMPTSPVGYHSPMMPGSPIGNQMMYPNNTVQLQPPPVEQFAPISLPPLSLDMPLSITVRAPTAMDGGMPVYAAATPPPSHPGSPAISPVSSLTSRMNALAPNFGYDDEPELEIIEDLTNSPTLQECANELMDVLFDGNQTEDANHVQPVLVEPTSMSLATDLGDLDFDI